MSIESAKVLCTGCDFQAPELHQPILIRYQTSNGDIIETGRSKGWCYACSTYSDIEPINLEELYEQLYRAEQKRITLKHSVRKLGGGLFSWIGRRSEKKQLQREIAHQDNVTRDLAGLIAIAKQRQSPPRCLRCWSTSTATFSFDSQTGIAEGFEHECGGKLKITCEGDGLRVNFRPSILVLNEEGEPVESK